MKKLQSIDRSTNAVLSGRYKMGTGFGQVEGPLIVRPFFWSFRVESFSEPRNGCLPLRGHT